MRIATLVLGAALLTGGCNTSAVPIADVAAAPFDSTLVGIWAGNIESAVPDTLIIYEFRRPEYYIEVVPQNDKEERMRTRGYISAIDATRFMNVKELSPKPAGYTFYSFDVRNDTLVVRMLSDASTKFTSSAELRGYLAANLKNAALYEEQTLRFWRVKLD